MKIYSSKHVAKHCFNYEETLIRGIITYGTEMKKASPNIDNSAVFIEDFFNCLPKTEKDNLIIAWRMDFKIRYIFLVCAVTYLISKSTIQFLGENSPSKSFLHNLISCFRTFL